MTTDLKPVAGTILDNFGNDPRILQATLIAMAVIACLHLDDLPHCIGLNFIGPPASSKTTVLDFFEGLPMVYRSDSFTPRSFVSHYAGKSKDALDDIDLLRKIAHMCIVIAELAPLFEARRENLMEVLAILTRMFDGRGFQSDSGVHGQRGYSGDYRFAWLGATTPLPNLAWQVMGKLGSRLVFFDMGEGPDTPEEVAKNLKGKPYRDRIEDCRKVVHDFMDSLWTTNGGYGGVHWDADDDPTLLLEIAKMASAVAKWRGVIQGESESGHNPPQIEAPHRLAATLLYLARGFALVYGRTELSDQDVEMVHHIAYSSMPEDRRRIYEALRSEGRLTSGDVESLVRCTRPTAIKVMRELRSLGVVTMTIGERDSPSWIELA